MALRIEKPIEEHTFCVHVAELYQWIENSNTALQAYNESIKNVKLTEAEEKIARANLRRQYENNY